MYNIALSTHPLLAEHGQVLDDLGLDARLLLNGEVAAQTVGRPAPVGLTVGAFGSGAVRAQGELAREDGLDWALIRRQWALVVQEQVLGDGARGAARRGG